LPFIYNRLEINNQLVHWYTLMKVDTNEPAGVYTCIANIS